MWVGLLSKLNHHFEIWTIEGRSVHCNLYILTAVTLPNEHSTLGLLFVGKLKQ